MLTIPMPIMAASEEKEWLMEKLNLTLSHAEKMGLSSSVSTLQNMKVKFIDMPDEKFKIYSSVLQSESLNERLDLISTRIENHLLAPVAEKEVDTDVSPDTLSYCVDVDPIDVELILATKFIADEAMAVAKWACLESVLGENTADVCTVLEVNAVAYEALYKFSEFCLKNQSYSENTAMFTIVKDIGGDLNSFVDAKLSDQASQDSADLVQDGLDNANENMDEFFPSLDTSLITTLDELDMVNVQLNDISSKADSLLFRTQVNQIEIETIEITASDIQERSEEIRDDTQSLISSNQSLLNQLLALHAQTQTMAKITIQEQIESILARSTAIAPISFQTPASAGGQIESVREVLVSHLISISSLGGKVTVAQNLLSAGDADYNSGQFKSAYNNYSSAYKALQEVSF
jgi:hypothetical protein